MQLRKVNKHKLFYIEISVYVLLKKATPVFKEMTRDCFMRTHREM